MKRVRHWLDLSTTLNSIFALAPITISLWHIPANTGGRSVFLR
jgi:hypothetical protein